MLRLNINEIKTNISRYIPNILRGESILVCRRNIPIGMFVPLEGSPEKKRRPIGLAREEFTVPEDINSPLPDEVLLDFEGSL